MIKAGAGRPKTGTIRIEDAGKTYYRVACDRCTEMVTTPQMPTQEREVVCSSCRWVANKAKPSTKVRRRGHQTNYFTECDRCGKVQKTPFMPKKERAFLCDGCYGEERASDHGGPVAEPETRETPSPAPAGTRAETTSPAKNQDRQYEVACRKCGLRVSVRFLPRRGERFVCKDCFLAESARKDRQKQQGTHGTRLMFNIECVRCGKVEQVDFVPKSLTEAVCTDCYPKKPRRN